MFKELDDGIQGLIRNVIEIVYFMRGGIQYDDMMWRTPKEKQMFAEFIESRLNSESKKHFPIY